MTDRRNTGNHRTDVAVIGGGLAGLTAAAFAARSGARVTVIDGRAVGGRARSAARDGFTLNEGAHALYRRGVALAALDELGIAVPGGSPKADTFRLVWDGHVVPMPAGPAALAASRLLSARSKVKLAGWISNAHRHANGCGDVPVAQWLDDQRAAPDLRRYVVAVMRLGSYAAQPEHAAAPLLLRQLALGAHGVLYLDGGWQSIVDRLTHTITALGVEIVDHEAVTSVQRSDGVWEVSSARRTVSAGAVVFAAGGPTVATALLGADEAGWVGRAGPVQRAAVLDIGGRAAEHGFLLSADEPLYFSTHAPVARLAPDGQHLVTAMRYLSADDDTSAAANREALERHATMAGAAPPAERSLDRFLAAPVVSWGSPVPGVLRPTGLELAAGGVYAAGDWVGDHLIADAAVASGRAAGLAAARARVAA
jgi:phytoene dehydrogenase-like protein